jgi:hypothetical protein
LSHTSVPDGYQVFETIPVRFLADRDDIAIIVSTYAGVVVRLAWAGGTLRLAGGATFVSGEWGMLGHSAIPCALTVVVRPKDQFRFTAARRGVDPGKLTRQQSHSAD